MIGLQPEDSNFSYLSLWLEKQGLSLNLKGYQREDMDEGIDKGRGQLLHFRNIILMYSSLMHQCI